MGGTSTQSGATSNTTNPWAPAIPALNSLLSGVQGLAGNTGLTGNQSGAISGLENNAGFMGQFAPQISGFANNMLAGGGANNQAPMVNDAYSRLQSQLGGTANGDYLDPNKNPWMSQVTSTIGDDVQNRLSGLYAGSGRDPAGAGNFGGWLGRGIAEGVAPVFGQQYQQERQNQLGAQNQLYGAGNATAGLLGNFQNQYNQNQGTGINAAGAAQGASNDPYNQMLAAEAQKRGIPVSMLQQLAGIAGPLAGLGGTQQGTSSGTSTMSGAQQFGMIGQGIGGIGKALWG